MEFLVTTVLKKVEMGIYYIILSSLVFLVIGIDTLIRFKKQSIS